LLVREGKRGVEIQKSNPDSFLILLSLLLWRIEWTNGQTGVWLATTSKIVQLDEKRRKGRAA